MRTLTVVITVAVVSPYILIVALPGVLYMRYIYNTGIDPMIAAQRFDQIFVGPINSTFNSSIQGMVTLRSYRKFDFFRVPFLEAIEKSANSTFCYCAVNRWVGIRLDAICVAFGVATTSICVALKGSVDREKLTFSL